MSPENKSIPRLSFNIFLIRVNYILSTYVTQTRQKCRSPLEQYDVTQLHYFGVLETVNAPEKVRILKR